jgi:hypothetical protein
MTKRRICREIKRGKNKKKSICRERKRKRKRKRKESACREIKQRD